MLHKGQIALIMKRNEARILFFDCNIFKNVPIGLTDSANSKPGYSPSTQERYSIMKKNFVTTNLKKASAMGGAALLSAGMLAPMAPALAGTTYTPVAGTSCNFQKYLIMDAGDNVPNATFSFTVAAGTAQSVDTSDNDSMQVNAGNDGVTSSGLPTIADITFASSDSTSTTPSATQIDITRDEEDRTGTAGTDTVQLDSGEKFAVHQGTIDFSQVTFNEPGIYRYVVSETANATHAAAGIIHDSDTDRILDVYVVDNNGTLEVASYVLHTEDEEVTINATMGSADVATALAAVEDKTDGFTNEYVSKDLVFKKEVTGNQASRDKYFEFTATCTNVNDDDVFTVSLADDSDANTTDGNADATSGTTAATIAANQSKTNPTSVTGAQLKAGVKFYLQHGQSIAIRGLAPNAGYSITENAEDYAATGAAVTGHTDAVSGTIGTVAGDNKAVKTSYLNERSGIIPTGVILGIGGTIVLAGAAGAGILANRRRKEEEE